jgi:DNA replication and repair protein RecF
VGLIVSRVSLNDFRNWESFELEPHPWLTVLVGPNAVGKTSVIEGIQLLTEAVSFRRPSWVDTIRWGSERAVLSLQAAGDGRSLETVLEIESAGKRTYRVNGKIRRKISEVTGVVPCVTFTPDDLGLVKESAERRRSSLDSIGIQLSPAFAKTKQEYERVLRQRNVLLKESCSDGSLQVWDDRLIETGSRLTEYRIRLFNRLQEPMASFYSQLAEGETLSAHYWKSWERDGQPDDGQSISLSMEEHLTRRGADERARRTSLVGPHRDDIEFLVDGRSARSFGSQGQQRTISLAWKLAEVSVVKEVAAQPPVLLLDDVMSELDQNRRDALATMVGSAAQTFVTTTHLGYFDNDMIQRSLVVNL